MRILWVLLISGTALVVGSLGMFSARAASVVMDEMKMGCAILNAAESGGILTNDQRVDIVARAFKKLETSSPMNAEAQAFWARGCRKG
jgi:hypothetical protein